MESLIHIGIDIGQVQDPTAVAVTEVKQVTSGQQFARYAKQYPYSIPTAVYKPTRVTEYTLRHIERLPLGMSYPAIATRIADILEAMPIRFARRTAWVDVTGVGRPVFQMVEEQVRTREHTQKVWLQPIIFVHGDEYNRKDGSLGKGYFVSRLQAVLQNGWLHAPDTEEVRATIEELKVYERRISEAGTDTYGAFRSGFHDDLATALGLSVLDNPYAHMIQELDPEIADALRWY